MNVGVGVNVRLGVKVWVAVGSVPVGVLLGVKVRVALGVKVLV